MLINLAHAADAAPQDPGLMGFLPLIVIFVLFYFMLLRPNLKRAKDQQAMVNSLQKGDEVITAGGTLGKVVKVTDSFVTVEVAENTQIHVQKNAIQTLLPKGTIKDLEK
jgi:preprotein translocase subunit YajC